MDPTKNNQNKFGQTNYTDYSIRTNNDSTTPRTNMVSVVSPTTRQRLEVDMNNDCSNNDDDDDNDNDNDSNDSHCHSVVDIELSTSNDIDYFSDHDDEDNDDYMTSDHDNFDDNDDDEDRYNASTPRRGTYNRNRNSNSSINRNNNKNSIFSTSSNNNTNKNNNPFVQRGSAIATTAKNSTIRDNFHTDDVEEENDYDSDYMFDNTNQNHNADKDAVAIESEEYESSYSPAPSPLPNSAPINVVVATTTTMTTKGLHHRHARNRSNPTYNDGINSSSAVSNILTNSDLKKKQRRGMNHTTAFGNRFSSFISATISRFTTIAGGGGGGGAAAAAPYNLTSSINHHHQQHRRKGFAIPIGRYVQSCVIVSIPAYLLGLVLFLYSASTRSNYNDDPYRSLAYSDQSNPNEWERTRTIVVTKLEPEYYRTIYDRQIDSTNLRTLRQQHMLHDDGDINNNNNSNNIINHSQQFYDTIATSFQQTSIRRATSRRSRTQSLLSATHQSEADDSLVDPYDLHSASDLAEESSTYEVPSDQSSTKYSKKKDDKPASLESLCGSHAQSASLQSPESFHYKDALVKTSASKVRVLITGIVSTPVGYRLAQVLKQRCGVSVMIGFDSLYPNSHLNRLAYQEQMSIITKMTPKIVKPFFTGYVGLDPIKHARNFESLPATSELDVVQTFQPSHIVHLQYHNADHSFSSDDVRMFEQSPYLDEGGKQCTNDGQASAGRKKNPPFNTLKNSRVAMEQILASIANTPEDDRPHFVYASTSPTAGTQMNISPSGCSRSSSYVDKTVHRRARQVDEILADYYRQQFNVFSVGMRLPTGIYGPWDHAASPIHRILRREAAKVASNTNIVNETAFTTIDEQQQLDMMFVDDVVDAMIAAMQYRPNTESSAARGRSTIFELSSGQTRTVLDTQSIASEFIRVAQEGIETSIQSLEETILPKPRQDDTNSRWYKQMLARTGQQLGWSPHAGFYKGLLHTIGWHLDRINLHGPPPLNSNALISTPTSDTSGTLSKTNLFDQLSIPACQHDDILCHGGQQPLPCASECALHKQNECLPTIFDSLIALSQELSQECDIVLYTQLLDSDATDLELTSEFMNGGNPMVCNFAYVNQNSALTNAVLEKVPDEELKNLDFQISVEDSQNPGSIRKRKFEALNGRLLYRGWILIWADNVPDDMPTYESSLLKLSPGRFFSKDVKHAVYIEQNFHVSPKADDIIFLAHEMNRDYLEPRVIKRKNRPKTKFLLPPEPKRQAVILVPELKFQDAADARRLPSDEKISIYEATRFMRFEIGEETPLGKEPAAIKRQREFYERIKGYANPDYGRSPNEPTHKFEMSKWVRTRWVAHDLTSDESRTDVRCPWYKEHILWETPLDQLSLAYILEMLDSKRKFDHDEPDDTVQKQLSEGTKLKGALTDTFEWIALNKQENRQYSPHEQMQMLPYELDFVTDEKKQQLWPTHYGSDKHKFNQPLLFVRIISDRIMAIARKTWNSDKKHGKHKIKK